MANIRKRDLPDTRVLCLVEECSGTAIGRGFCSRHYEQWRRNKLDAEGQPIAKVKPKAKAKAKAK